MDGYAYLRYWWDLVLIGVNLEVLRAGFEWV
jgi:hypothetical protein